MLKTTDLQVGDGGLWVHTECCGGTWLQPEGSRFARCPECGEFARPRGWPGEERRTLALGLVGRLVLEQDAAQVAWHGNGLRARWRRLRRRRRIARAA